MPNFREIRAIRAARKLAGREVYEAAKKTTDGQSALDNLVVTIMNFFRGKAGKHDVGCMTETVIDLTSRKGSSSGKARRVRTGSRTPGSPR